jgi:subtilase family serine protease
MLMPRMLQLVLLAFTTATVLSSCTSRPDLVPVPLPGVALPGGFCSENKDGRLSVLVKNQGTVDALSSVTTVQCGTTILTASTRAIPLSDSTAVLFDIPRACFQPDCHFRIRVDADHQVNESNEWNNTVEGVCRG